MGSEDRSHQRPRPPPSPLSPLGVRMCTGPPSSSPAPHMVSPPHEATARATGSSGQALDALCAGRASRLEWRVRLKSAMLSLLREYDRLDADTQYSMRESPAHPSAHCNPLTDHTTPHNPVGSPGSLGAATVKRDYQQLLSTHCECRAEEPSLLETRRFEEAYQTLQQRSLQRLVEATVQADISSEKGSSAHCAGTEGTGVGAETPVHSSPIQFPELQFHLDLDDDSEPLEVVCHDASDRDGVHAVPAGAPREESIVGDGKVAWEVNQAVAGLWNKGKRWINRMQQKTRSWLASRVQLKFASQIVMAYAYLIRNDTLAREAGCPEQVLV